MSYPFGKVAYSRLLKASEIRGIFVTRNSGGRVVWLGPAASRGFPTNRYRGLPATGPATRGDGERGRRAAARRVFNITVPSGMYRTCRTGRSLNVVIFTMKPSVHKKRQRRHPKAPPLP